MRHIADRCKEARVKAGDADDDWELVGMVSANEVTTSEVRRRIKVTQRIRENGGNALSAFNLKTTKLSRKVVETKHDNAKMMDSNNDLVGKLDEC